MNAPRITVDQVMSWRPCGSAPGGRYCRENVAALWRGHAALTPLEICDLPIPAVDRLWVLLRPGCIPKHKLYLLTCDFTEHAQSPNTDPRSLNAIVVLRHWIARATAWVTAWATWDDAWIARVARNAARDAVWVVVSDANRAFKAARVAALTAVSDANRTAAWASWKAAKTVRDAISDAEVEWQLMRVREVLSCGEAA